MTRIIGLREMIAEDTRHISGHMEREHEASRMDIAGVIHSIGKVACSSRPYVAILDPGQAYDVAVAARYDAYWLAQPFRICTWEKAGRMEERWAMRRKVRS